MNEKKLVQNFKSYINVSSKNGETNGAIQELKPKLLSGEAVAGSAHSVTLLAPFSENRSGKIGSLFVTNYKLTFIPHVQTPEDEPFQKNYLLDVHDISLSCVESIYITDSGRRRLLLPYGQIPNKVKGLQVVCKNMKVQTYSFEYSPIGHGRTVAMALLHHAYPKRHDLLFAYEHKEPYYPTLPHGLNMFLTPNDWKRELERCESPHWRITHINGTAEAFMSSAGTTLVVPNFVLDCALIETSRHFRSGRVPIWVWGRPEGAALLRSGELAATDQPAKTEGVYLENIRRTHPLLTPPYIIYLCGRINPANVKVPTTQPAAPALPSLPALQASYKKLIELCTPTTMGGFSVQDSSYYSALDSCKWLRYVSTCLTLADEAAQRLCDMNQTVVLQEGDGVDYSAAVASVAQLLVDAHWRSLAGFQSLVQKEWLALGHPFCDRLGLLEPPNPKQKDQSSFTPQPAPVFLLFLDCVWQLQAQFPTEFQFSETYLTTLWDSCHNQIFDTFLFNCPRDRESAVSKNFVLRPVWDWGEQFSEQDIALFYNPLYASNKPVIQNKQKLSTGARARLRARTAVADVALWAQSYERWLPPLEALGGGLAQWTVYQRAVLHDIHKLKEKLLSLSIMSNRQSNGENEATTIKRQLVPRFYPFSSQRADRHSPVHSTHDHLIDPTQLLDSQSLLNAPD